MIISTNWKPKRWFPRHRWGSKNEI